MYYVSKVFLFITIYFLLSKNPIFSQNFVIVEKDFETLRNITETLAIDFPDSALLYANKLATIAKASNSKQLIAISLSAMAKVKYKLSRVDEAIADNQKSFEINSELKNQDEIAKNYYVFGSIMYYKGNYVESVKYYLKSLNLAADLNLYSLQISNFIGLSIVSEAQKKIDESLNYLSKALEIVQKKPNELQKAEIYTQLGACYSRKNNISEAEKYFQLAYTIYTNSNKDFSQAYVLVKLSNLYYEKEPLRAIEIQLKAQKIIDSIAPDCLTSAYNIVYLGESFFELSKNDSLIKEIKNNKIPANKEQLLNLAEEYLKRGLLIVKKIKNVDGVLSAYSIISDIQAYRGDYKNAYLNYQSKFNYNDSLFSQKNKNAIAKLESEKEVLQLVVANKQKATLNKILFGGAALLLIISFLGYRNFRNKQKLQQAKITELEKDKQLLAIDAMLKGQEEERSRIAKDLHDGLGGMLSGTKLSFMNMKENLVLTPENTILFEKSLSMLDNTISDLRKVAHNLMPEALVKYGLVDALRDFCDSVQSSSNLKIVYQSFGENRKLSNTAEVFIYRIIQELVNNVVKHADAKQLIVQLTNNSNKIGIAVEDDGKGFDAASITNSKGDGLDNIKYRVQYLNGTIDTITSLGNGTSVNIEVIA